MGYTPIVVLGAAVHVLLLWSIFDVYYTSPVIRGMIPQKIELVPPASRLVLFVADGLRAQSFFANDSDSRSRIPFLQRIMKTIGRWGISNTRVPTESRPGHVALIAGFYEDVSAVATGWKENPVEFDSVFNRSRFTWSWGSPDILPMFAKGAAQGHVFTHSYASENEDFASKDASLLDAWVFDEVQKFFDAVPRNETLASLLRQDGLVFFLHLLGIDTTGHGYKPRSREYLENIRFVDQGIERIVHTVDSHFADGRTTYVFTSDHGMTDWGSHGAGDPEETMTPLVVWGAGIGDSRSEGPIDVEQADVAALMSALLAVPFPVNSVGRLPLGYLNVSEQYRAAAMCVNYRQALEQFLMIRELKANRTLAWLFREFPKLPLTQVYETEKALQRMLSRNFHEPATALCAEQLPIVLEGILYYHRYERTFLSICITFGFLTWVCFVIGLAGMQQVTWSVMVLSTKKGVIFLAVAALLFSTLKMPWTHYLYALLPVYMTLANWHVWKLAGFSDRRTWAQIAARLALLFVGVESLVLSFQHRGILSVAIAALSFLPFSTHFVKLKPHVRIFWIVSCVLNSFFPALPTVGKKTSFSLVAWTSVIAACCFCLLQWLLLNAASHLVILKRYRRLLGLQLVLTMIAGFVVWYTARSIELKHGSPWPSRVFSWTALAFCPLLPMFYDPSSELLRLLTTAAALYIPYVLLSISHEVLFYLAFSMLLASWITVEGAVKYERESLWTRLRRAYMVIFLTLFAFFGTGNIASLNSFNPNAVQCFLTVFQPFVMTALLVGKILLPILLVGCCLATLERQAVTRSKDVFLMTLVICDLMAVHFFFMLKDEGSWLDIGTSISQYAICMLTTIALCVLTMVASLYMSLDLFVDKATQKDS